MVYISAVTIDEVKTKRIITDSDLMSIGRHGTDFNSRQRSHRFVCWKDSCGVNAQIFFPKLGDHQFAFPMRRIAEGTTIARTIVASTKTATARARPIDLMIITSANMKPENTAIIIAAAPVIKLPEA